MVAEDDFKMYVEWRLNQKGLFERGFIQSLNGLFTQLSLERRSEPAYLASLASLAGGWNTEVGRKPVDNLGVQSIDDLRNADLTTLPEPAEYHSHRHLNYRDVDKAVKSLRSLSYDGTNVSSITEFVDSIHTKKQVSGSTEAFNTGMKELQTLETLGRMALLD